MYVYNIFTKSVIKNLDLLFYVFKPVAYNIIYPITIRTFFLRGYVCDHISIILCLRQFLEKMCVPIDIYVQYTYIK